MGAISFQVGNGFDSFPSKTQFEARLPFSLRTSLLLYKNLFPGALQQFLELRNSILYTHSLCYVHMYGKESEVGKEPANTQFEARLPFSLRTPLLLYKNLFPDALQQFLGLRNSVLYTHSLYHVQIIGWKRINAFWKRIGRWKRIGWKRIEMQVF